MEKGLSESILSKPLSFAEQLREKRVQAKKEQKRKAKEDNQRAWSVLSPIHGVNGPFPLHSKECNDALDEIDIVLLKQSETVEGITLDFLIDGIHVTDDKWIAVGIYPSKSTFEEIIGTTLINDFIDQSVHQLTNGFHDRHPEFVIMDSDFESDIKPPPRPRVVGNTNEQTISIYW